MLLKTPKSLGSSGEIASAIFGNSEKTLLEGLGFAFGILRMLSALSAWEEIGITRTHLREVLDA